MRRKRARRRTEFGENREGASAQTHADCCQECLIPACPDGQTRLTGNRNQDGAAESDRVGVEAREGMAEDENEGDRVGERG